MKLQHFKIEYELGKRQDLISQYQNDFEKLDQMLEQYQDQDFDWYLNYNGNRFELVCSYKNHNQSYHIWKDLWNVPEVIFISSNINQLANANALQRGLEIMKMIVNHPQIKDEEIIAVKTNFDEQHISLVHNGNANNYDQNRFEFSLIHFDQICNLLSKAIDFSTVLNRNRNDQNANLKASLELQVLKMIIDQEVDQNSDQFIQKFKSDLANPNVNFLHLSHNLNNRSNDRDLLLNQLDWQFGISENEKIQFMATINYDGDYYSFTPLELSFQTVAKLTNNPQINAILKSWKQDLATKKQLEKVGKII